MSTVISHHNPLLIDYKEGSYQLAESPILSTILEPCDSCSGSSCKEYHGCKECRFTGKNLYHLNSGDVSFLGNGPKGKISIAVEIKRFDDLLSSLSTKRLQFQLKKMIQDYPSIYSRWLLIYGKKRRNPKPGTTQGLYQLFNEEKHYWQDTYGEFSNPKNLNRFLCSPSFTSFFHLHWEDTREEAIHWIYDLYKVWQKKWTSHRSMKDDRMDVESDFDYLYADSDPDFSDSSSSLGITLSLPNPRLEQNIRFARSIPGIKHDRAKAIANHFWDMEEMTNASIDELSDIGVKTSDGKRVIKLGKNGLRIWNAIHWKRGK